MQVWEVMVMVENQKAVLKKIDKFSCIRKKNPFQMEMGNTISNVTNQIISQEKVIAAQIMNKAYFS